MSPLTATATVVDAPLVAVGSESITGVEGITTGPKLVATWTDTNQRGDGRRLHRRAAARWWSTGVTAPRRSRCPASAITASGSPNGVVFSATAAHTYAEEGNYQITTTIDDDGGSTAVAHGFAVIADAPLTAAPQVRGHQGHRPELQQLDLGAITEAIPFTAVVATFNDANPLAPISDYANVTIDWGDGTPTSAGTVIQPGGVGTTFEVLGTHTYAYAQLASTAVRSISRPSSTSATWAARPIVINASVTVANLPLTPHRPAQPEQRQR